MEGLYRTKANRYLFPILAGAGIWVGDIPSITDIELVLDDVCAVRRVELVVGIEENNCI